MIIYFIGELMKNSYNYVITFLVFLEQKQTKFVLLPTKCKTPT